MTELRLHRLALREYRRAQRWYRKRSDLTEERFIRSITQSLEQIERAPLLAPAAEDNIRWIKAKRFPFLLYYEYFPGDVGDVALVLAIAHDKRRQNTGASGEIPNA